MKYVILIPILATVVACKQESMDTEKSPAPKPLIQTNGCQVTKDHGKITITCADGSLAEFDEPAAPAEVPPALHIKDGNGTEYSKLFYITSNGNSTAVLNKESGNVLSYDGSGNVSAIIKTLYESANCTGTAYAYPSYSLAMKNRVLANSNAWPGGVTALRVVGFSGGTYINFGSQFQNGSCSAATGSANQMSIVEPASFDATDLQSIALPIEVVQ